VAEVRSILDLACEHIRMLAVVKQAITLNPRHDRSISEIRIFHQPTPALGYRREVAGKESHVKNRSLQVYGKLVVVLPSLGVRNRTASCGPVLVDWNGSYGH